MPAFRKPRGVQVTKCTPEVIDKISQVLRIGAYPETAAAMAGVRKETFLDWMRWSYKDDPQYRKRFKPIYAELRHAVFKAIEECTARDLYSIDRAANPPQTAIRLKDETGTQLLDKDGLPLIIKPMQPDWQAAAWRLERRSKGWVKTEKIQHSGVDDGPIQMAEETEEERKTRIEDKLARLKLMLQ